MKAEGTVLLMVRPLQSVMRLGLIDWARALPKHKWWWGNGSKILGDDRFVLILGALEIPRCN